MLIWYLWLKKILAKLALVLVYILGFFSLYFFDNYDQFIVIHVNNEIFTSIVHDNIFMSTLSAFLHIDYCLWHSLILFFLMSLTVSLGFVLFLKDRVFNFMNLLLLSLYGIASKISFNIYSGAERYFSFLGDSLIINKIYNYEDKYAMFKDFVNKCKASDVNIDYINFSTDIYPSILSLNDKVSIDDRICELVKIAELGRALEKAKATPTFEQQASDALAWVLEHPITIGTWVGGVILFWYFIIPFATISTSSLLQTLSQQQLSTDKSLEAVRAQTKALQDNINLVNAKVNEAASTTSEGIKELQEGINNAQDRIDKLDTKVKDLITSLWEANS